MFSYAVVMQKKCSLQTGECIVKAETFNDAHLYDVYYDNDETFDPMIVLGFYPDTN